MFGIANFFLIDSIIDVFVFNTYYESIFLK